MALKGSIWWAKARYDSGVQVEIYDMVTGEVVYEATGDDATIIFYMSATPYTAIAGAHAYTAYRDIL